MIETTVRNIIAIVTKAIKLKKLLQLNDSCIDWIILDGAMTILIFSRKKSVVKIDKVFLQKLSKYLIENYFNRSHIIANH